MGLFQIPFLFTRQLMSIGHTFKWWVSDLRNQDIIMDTFASRMTFSIFRLAVKNSLQSLVDQRFRLRQRIYNLKHIQKFNLEFVEWPRLIVSLYTPNSVFSIQLLARDCNRVLTCHMQIDILVNMQSYFRADQNIIWPLFLAHRIYFWFALSWWMNSYNGSLLVTTSVSD